MRGRKKFARTESSSSGEFGNFDAEFKARRGIFEFAEFEKNPAQFRTRKDFEKIADSHTLRHFSDCRTHETARLSGKMYFLSDGSADAKKLSFERAGGDAGGAGGI